MSSKEFIRDQIEKLCSSLTLEQFAGLSECDKSLIILEVALKDYTLTEIARIVESNNARVMTLNIIPVSSGEKLLISLKFDVDDVTALLRSFERFNYHTVFYLTREGAVTETQKDRLDELLYYLEM